ncbi:MAG TPA: 2-isopropylmalate synthase [Solirubrobacteraceae bacterium]|jgi:2-isopropylmalate synthase|nr:2-isopropylmalate synthase [Solirubrobacteraceae bacterium]
MNAPSDNNTHPERAADSGHAPYPPPTRAADPARPAPSERVLIFDTTLRDGEQAPGIALNSEEKLRIAKQLARLGVDVMEAGFPVSSPGEFEALRTIAREVEGPVICALARTDKRDIDLAWQALREADRARIDIVTSASDIHIEHQLNSTREDVKGQVRAAVAHARTLTEDVEISPMDTTRADVEYLAEMIDVAIAEGANTVDLPDTVGYAMPHEFGAMIERLYELVPALSDVTLSVHCHDDLGLAVANSLAGVIAGARQVHCTINGIGERAGNASLEEFVMLLRMRNAAVGLDTGIDTTEIMATSRLVAELTGFAVPPNKAIVGRNAFMHEAGIHQDGVLKHRATYEIIDAAAVGRTDNHSIFLGKHSGRHGLRRVLEEMGCTVEGRALNRAFTRFKELADEKQALDRADLEALLHQVQSDAVHTTEAGERSSPAESELGRRA